MRPSYGNHCTDAIHGLRRGIIKRAVQGSNPFAVVKPEKIKRIEVKHAPLQTLKISTSLAGFIWLLCWQKGVGFC